MMFVINYLFFGDHNHVLTLNCFKKVILFNRIIILSIIGLLTIQIDKTRSNNYKSF